MILSLRVVDLVRRVPSLSDEVTLVLPFETRSPQRSELAWEDAIIALLSSQHLWEAQTLLAIHIRHHGVKAVSKPVDILDAVPRRQDAMYMLAYLTILTLLSKTLSWEKSVTDTHLQYWKKSLQNKIDPLSRPMDDITDPVTTSRAYQKLLVFQLTTTLKTARSGKGDEEPANAESNVDVSEALAGLRDLRFEAVCHKDYLLAMEIYEASGDILPDEYLEATGALKEAIEVLHPDIILPDTLQAAPERGDINMVDKLLAAGADVNAEGSRYGSRSNDLNSPTSPGLGSVTTTGGGPITPVISNKTTKSVEQMNQSKQPFVGQNASANTQNVLSVRNLINSPDYSDTDTRSQHESAYSSGTNSTVQHSITPQLNIPGQKGTANPIRETKGRYTLDDFELQRTLGTGSFSHVRLVQSKLNQRFYAVKVWKKAHVVKMKQVEHTNNERRMLQRCKHPFLIKLWGTFQDSKNLYMIMDFIEGGELFSLMRKSMVSH
jgi:hypothetical protein